MFPNRVPMDRDAPSPNQWFIHLSVSPVKESSHKTGKTYGHHLRSPTRMEGLHTVGCGLVPKGDHLRHCSLYPVPCSLQHNTFHLGLGRPEAP